MAETKKNQKLSPARAARFLGLSFLGMTIYAIGIVCFTSPNKVSPGGLTAIAAMLQSVFGVPIGVMMVLLNIPLIIWASKEMDKKFVRKMVFGVVSSSVILDLVGYIMNQNGLIYADGNPILAALFGGVFMGVGVSLSGLSGTSSGGTNTLCILLHKKNPQLEVGKIHMLINGVIILVSALVYREIEAAMYAIICIFTYGRTMDAISYGLNANLMVIIISEKSEEIREAMFHEIGRGSTILDGQGAYRRYPLEVILTVVAKSEYHPLRQIVEEVDPDAFMISAESGEVMGKGFHKRGF